MSGPSSSGAGLRSSSIRSHKSKPRADLVGGIDNSLERANTTSAAIRRGELKISGPIPITQDEGEEFPLRNTDGPKLMQSPPLPNHSRPSHQTVSNGVNGAKRPRTATEASYQVSALGPETAFKQRPNTIGAETQVLHKPMGKSNPGSRPHDSTTSYGQKSSSNRKSKGTSLGGIVRRLFGRKQKKVVSTPAPGQAENNQNVSISETINQDPQLTNIGTEHDSYAWTGE